MDLCLEGPREANFAFCQAGKAATTREVHGPKGAEIIVCPLL
jgi:hypothetical protein